VGDVGPGGGIVFYDAGTTKTWGRYLEAAPTDYQVNGLRDRLGWGCYMVLKNITATAIGTGKANTAEILDLCDEPSIAARVAADYRGGGKSDWFLPSKDELNLMYTNRVAIGGFSSVYYWSSSEYDAKFVSATHFEWKSDEDGDDYGKLSRAFMRPVRAF